MLEAISVQLGRDGVRRLSASVERLVDLVLTPRTPKEGTT
jgi:hypothetical protein